MRQEPTIVFVVFIFVNASNSLNESAREPPLLELARLDIEVPDDSRVQAKKALTVRGSGQSTVGESPVHGGKPISRKTAMVYRAGEDVCGSNGPLGMALEDMAAPPMFGLAAFIAVPSGSASCT